MPTRSDDILQWRRDKLERIRERGIDPYPPRYRRSHTTKEAAALFEHWEEAGADQGQRPAVRLAGRIVASRDMGKASFADIKDGSGRIQLYFRKDGLGDQFALLSDLDIGDIVGAEGGLFRTRSGEITLEVSDFAVLAKSLQPLPEKWHGLADVEKRYRQRYLDTISNEGIGAIFRARSKAVSAVRRFLDERGFIEVETPVFHASPGGAAARPFVTHHHALDQDLYLRIATELYLKRLVIGGFDKVYEIGRIFRNEGISTRHNPEFTMLESYEAYADYTDVMAMLEQMVASVANEVRGSTVVSYAGTAVDLAPPWQRIALREAIVEGCGIDIEEYRDESSLKHRMEEIGVFTGDIRGVGKLIDKLISSFVEPALVQPTIVVDYPVELSPLAKRKPESERMVERFEAFAGGMEIANAFTELNDPIEQRQRFEEQERLRALAGDEETERVDEDFLLALEHGMPPTGGLGVGIDRLVMLLTDQQSIREVILFPQLRSR